ncbi:hypothetical protein QYF61_027086 [Mycteria americana]|uniref:Reverse transcriptase domain-containing protein n=1 Tax=Mycteria americana TaxID=33587 RepID=A0AAN7ND92_MYCAM|nr:hypothetical protein QYF61_027086 [Mycteria americana]
MLAGPDHPLVMYMPHDGTQDDLLHNLPQHRECPAFLDSFALQDCFPRDSVNQSPKQAKGCPAEVQGSSSADPPPHFSKNQKLYHFVIAMPKTASNHHITHKSFSVHKKQVQQESKGFFEIPQKLMKHGLDKWIAQRVVINGTKSSWRPVTNGVRQGFIPGPIVFNIFINGLDNGTERTLSNFADVQNWEEWLYCHRRDPDSLKKWTNRYVMKFNRVKCLHLGWNNPIHQYRLGAN